jgi:hypothetical protein
MTIEQVPDITMFGHNTVSSVDDLDAGCLANVDGTATASAFTP